MRPQAVPAHFPEALRDGHRQPDPAEGRRTVAFDFPLDHDGQPPGGVENVAVSAAHAPSQDGRRDPGGDVYLHVAVGVTGGHGAYPVLQVMKPVLGPLLRRRRHPQSQPVVVRRRPP